MGYTHTVDRFASVYNCQLPRFNSCCWNSGSEAVDAFTGVVKLTGGAPPIHLIPRVICHAQVCVAKGMLIVPCWLSAPCWPLICPPGGQFAGFITVSRELALTNTLFLPGLSGSVLFNGQQFNLRSDRSCTCMMCLSINL